MSRWNLAWLLILPTALAGSLLVRFATASLPKDKDYERMRLIADVLAEVEKNYVEDLDDAKRQKLVENMINGGLHKLDEHSMYLNQDMLKEFEKQSVGEFAGVGFIMTFDPKSKRLVIDTPLPNSPAYEAGIQSGDEILKVGDVSAENLNTDEARKLITGKPGTQVSLTMLRGGSKTPEVLTLTRAMIDQPVVSGVSRDPENPVKWSFTLDDANKIALIRLNGFSGKTTKELRYALDQCEAAGMKAYILDLRDNPGGLLDQAIDVSDLFLASGDIVRTKVRTSERSWSAKDDGKPFEKSSERPMAVLVNQGSASASEIVAGALQDNGRAVVVGARTYGKGSVQKVFDLPEGGAVKVTTEVWVTPSGKQLQRRMTIDGENGGVGIEPNEGMKIDLTDEQWRHYAIAQNRLRTLPGKPGVAPKPLPVPEKPEMKLPANYKDPAVEKALEHLKKKLNGNRAAS